MKTRARALLRTIPPAPTPVIQDDDQVDDAAKAGRSRRPTAEYKAPTGSDLDLDWQTDGSAGSYSPIDTSADSADSDVDSGSGLASSTSRSTSMDIDSPMRATGLSPHRPRDGLEVGLTPPQRRPKLLRPAALAALARIRREQAKTPSSADETGSLAHQARAQLHTLIRDGRLKFSLRSKRPVPHPAPAIVVHAPCQLEPNLAHQIDPRALGALRESLAVGPLPARAVLIQGVPSARAVAVIQHILASSLPPNQGLVMHKVGRQGLKKLQIADLDRLAHTHLPGGAGIVCLQLNTGDADLSAAGLAHLQSLQAARGRQGAPYPWQWVVLMPYSLATGLTEDGIWMTHLGTFGLEVEPSATLIQVAADRLPAPFETAPVAAALKGLLPQQVHNVLRQLRANQPRHPAVDAATAQRAVRTARSQVAGNLGLEDGIWLESKFGERSQPPLPYALAHLETMVEVPDEVLDFAAGLTDPIRTGHLLTQGMPNMILWGPPGSGKTTMARAIAQQGHSNFYCVPASFILSGGGGDDDTTGEDNVASDAAGAPQGSPQVMVEALFAAAQARADSNGRYSVLFIDEAEQVLESRTQGEQSKEDNRLTAKFLEMLEGFQRHHPAVVCLFALNPADKLDAGMISRCLTVEVKRPSQAALAAMARVALPLGQHDLTEAEIDELARHGQEAQLTGREVRLAAQLAGLRALRRARVSIDPHQGRISHADYAGALRREMGKSTLTRRTPLATHLPLPVEDLLGAKKSITALLQALRTRDHADSRAYLQASARLLLQGPAGTGRRTQALALAKSANIPCLMPTRTDVESPYFGTSESNVEAIFREAVSLARASGAAIIFFEDLDSLLPAGAGANTESQAHYGGMYRALLEGLARLKENATGQVLCIASVSDAKQLGPELSQLFPQREIFARPGLDDLRSFLSRQLTQHGLWPSAGAEPGQPLAPERAAALISNLASCAQGKELGYAELAAALTGLSAECLARRIRGEPDMLLKEQDLKRAITQAEGPTKETPPPFGLYL